MTYLNTTAIIRNLQKLQPTILDKNFQRRGPGIHSILNELFQSMHRGDDNLPGCNLIDYIRVQRLAHDNRVSINFCDICENGKRKT